MLNQISSPIHILGMELRTTNDNGQSFKDIPPFWQEFITNGYAEKIPNKL